MSEELYFNDELRKCLNAASLSDFGENDAWNYWYQRVHKAHDQAVDRVTEAQRVENARLREQVDAAHMSRLLTENENESLRELVRDVWRLFTEHGAVNPCDLPVVDAVRDRMRELGVEVDG